MRDSTTTHGSVLHYLDGLQAELDLARERYTQANGDEKFRPTLAAAHLAKLQRLSSHALFAAVDEAHEAGVPWRELAPSVQIHVATLHRKWQNGRSRGISVDGLAGTHDRPS